MEVFLGRALFPCYRLPVMPPNRPRGTAPRLEIPGTDKPFAARSTHPGRCRAGCALPTWRRPAAHRTSFGLDRSNLGLGAFEVGGTFGVVWFPKRLQVAWFLWYIHRPHSYDMVPTVLYSFMAPFGIGACGDYVVLRT